MGLQKQSELSGEEIAQQVRHGAPEFDTIVITDFSGGSQAGLLMAKQLAKLIRKNVANCLAMPERP